MDLDIEPEREVAVFSISRIEDLCTLKGFEVGIGVDIDNDGKLTIESTCGGAEEFDTKED